NYVIFLEVCISWFLLSSNWIRQRIALALFLLFHLYSVIIIDFSFPTIVVPVLLVAFLPRVRRMAMPRDMSIVPGLLLFALLFTGQTMKLAAPGDQKQTEDANRYGLFLFESNQQCLVAAEVYSTTGASKTIYKTTAGAVSRCDPYELWYQYTREY